MILQWTIFLGEQLLAIFIFALIALTAVWNRQKAFYQESLLPEIDSYPFERFQRFLATRARILRTYRQTQSMVLIVSATIIIGLSIGIMSLASSSGENSITTFINALFALVIGVLVGSYVNDIVGAIVVDGEAMRFFQIEAWQRSDVQRQKLRTLLLVYLPPLLIIEVFNITMFMNLDLYISIAILAFLAITRLTLRIVFSFQHYVLIKPLRPIKQSEWAGLEPRIKTWANLMGVELAGIYVQKDLIGHVNAHLVGLGKPYLMLSETFLRYSDWRQQDAMICAALGLVRKKAVQASMLLSPVIVFMLLGFLILTLTVLNSVTDPFLPLLIVILGYALMLWGYSYVRRRIKTMFFDADRLAVFTTGDPVALMVALNTIGMFNGISPTQRTALPSNAERMQYLDTLVRQSWPRAPQAGTPVPSMVAVTFGQHYLTVPLDRATEVGPVPATAFRPLQ